MNTLHVISTCLEILKKSHEVRREKEDESSVPLPSLYGDKQDMLWTSFNLSVPFKGLQKTTV